MDQPIDLNEFVRALEDLSQESINNAKDELFLSISKLVDTNTELEAEIANSDNHQDKKLYREVIEENQTVIYSKTSRYEASLNALRHKLIDDQKYHQELGKLYDLIKKPEAQDENQHGSQVETKDNSIYL
ncbi:uncharacterized protein CANTADRAFT_27058 [Suhomyces tanzawaensis NRRL Y-17324]|uniref:Uncharacterized protein n=1 Tax=Suhomyces tanzawaensis NRRL Y-17324 TaxID=984487 RepID=A0A1E4SF72_9ASCO|nr:uncharacterized protein CANTADRAFT_27058 [Suhomyces tanzawaensis NRRL Y-17324]ODV78138.1 hypothetical protein CANTADRAFT_27058 [Suhomyces tanzawaensis NRRL Y-17324]